MQRLRRTDCPTKVVAVHPDIIEMTASQHIEKTLFLEYLQGVNSPGECTFLQQEHQALVASSPVKFNVQLNALRSTVLITQTLGSCKSRAN